MPERDRIVRWANAKYKSVLAMKAGSANLGCWAPGCLSVADAKGSSGAPRQIVPVPNAQTQTGGEGAGPVLASHTCTDATLFV